MGSKLKLVSYTEGWKSRINSHERSYTRMCQELWDLITKDLAPRTTRNAAEIFGFELTEHCQKHNNVWDKILLPDEEWTAIATRQRIHVTLVGDDLHNLFHDIQQPAYLALVIGDRNRNIRWEKEKFLASLKAFDWISKNEITFRDSKITLNIDGALDNPFFISLPPLKLFSYANGKLRSASLYWHDSKSILREIGPNRIVGTGDLAITLEDVSVICAITLERPGESPFDQLHQQCFSHPNGPHAFPLHPTGWRYRGNNILGWELLK